MKLRANQIESPMQRVLTLQTALLVHSQVREQSDQSLAMEVVSGCGEVATNMTPVIYFKLMVLRSNGWQPGKIMSAVAE